MTDPAPASQAPLRFVCPLPRAWNDRYRDLVTRWERGGHEGPPPPVPLILAAWWESTDYAKHERWLATVAWATERGLADLVDGVPEKQQHRPGYSHPTIDAPDPDRPAQVIEVP